MRKYLATLHKRPEHHQKNFALAVSGGVTLFIFAIWLLVNFGSVSAVSDTQTEEVATLGRVKEVSPLESLGLSLAASWGSMKEAWGSLTQGFKGFDVEAGYDEMKEKTFETYAR